MTNGEATVRRVALITGAAQGLGAAIAKALHGAGHRVIFADIDVAKVESVVAGLQSEDAAAVPIDVRDKPSIERAAAICEERFGPVEILVNNAALTRATDFFDLSIDEWDDLMAVNLRSHFLTAQVIAAGMMERGFGRIINMTSVAGQRGGPGVQGLHYATSKAGIIGATRYLAQLFAEGGVTVNAIAPGPIQTEQTALAPPDRVARVAAQVPLKRFGNPSEVGALAVYLASDAAGFVTGATIDINGGILMR
ncbi:SDR family NAD(P)-dependent oxidoreductase [Georhizobium sp. MAB10]|uniref:SDR family NAD(P)-dependent oxidoreductase n=1 Tax=Georhizobium sp. MAB10 TaxID=3028319 RepID=UPI003855DF46